jgi:hypothetical protein
MPWHPTDRTVVTAYLTFVLEVAIKKGGRRAQTPVAPYVLGKQRNLNARASISRWSDCVAQGRRRPRQQAARITLVRNS